MNAAIDHATAASGSRIRALATILFLAPALLAPVGASAGKGYSVQVFALSGPVCPVAIAGRECPDVLLPGVELVLERYHKDGWTEVQRFETNISGYANLRVARRGRSARWRGRADARARPARSTRARSTS